MTDEVNIHRYDRQRIIQGWDQEKLTKSAVTIVGSGNLAKYTALPLVALGVGTIRIVDSAEGSENDALLDLPLEGKSRVKSLEAALRRINPEINVMRINSDLSTKAAQYFLNGSQVIIDATNDIISKSHVVDSSLREKPIPTISTSADETKGKVVYLLNKEQNVSVLPMFNGKQQGDLVSLLLGGVIAEEAKKVLMGDQNRLSHVYNYNLESESRFSPFCDRKVRCKENAFRGKKILLVGAGALGCFLGPATVNNLDIEQLDIMDFDTVEEHNLNRQVCFYDAVGQKKAEALAQTLGKITKKIKVNAIVDKFTEKFNPDVNYDLIFDAVDSFFTKAILHGYAREHNIPIVSGGTDVRAATVLTYAPTRTSCFDCQINLYDLAIKAEIIRRTSCMQAPNPSVIMTNQIAAALMTAEARSVLRPDLYGNPINGEIKYLADFESRGGVSHLEEICNCHAREARKLELPDPSRVEVVETEYKGQKIQEVYLDGRKL